MTISDTFNLFHYRATLIGHRRSFDPHRGRPRLGSLSFFKSWCCWVSLVKMSFFYRNLYDFCASSLGYTTLSHLDTKSVDISICKKWTSDLMKFVIKNCFYRVFNLVKTPTLAWNTEDGLADVESVNYEWFFVDLSGFMTIIISWLSFRSNSLQTSSWSF